MPAWHELANQVRDPGAQCDALRRASLDKLAELTGRNIILYYSAWLQKPDQYHHVPWAFTVTDEDKTGFMSAIHKLDRSRGLDLLLHTPGGSAAATESLVDYLRSMFGSDMRAVIPQLAMSAGTMIACACREIVLGAHSSLGPIDPQIDGMPAHGILEEFREAKKQIARSRAAIPVWQPIIAKYSPTLIGECDKAIRWTNSMVHDWLVSGMFAGQHSPAAKAAKVIRELGSHALTMSHARHISYDRARQVGLTVARLEDDSQLQDAVLTVHHASILTFQRSNVVKIIENHRGAAYVNQVRTGPA